MPLITNNNPNLHHQLNADKAISSITTMNNSSHHNRTIKVNFAPREKHSVNIYFSSENRSDHDRRQNGYAMHQQHSVEYSTNNPSSEQSNISSTQSYPSNLNSYNR